LKEVEELWVFYMILIRAFSSYKSRKMILKGRSKRDSEKRIEE